MSTTPPCPTCGQPLDKVENSKMLIGWRCINCKKAIMLDRAFYKVR